MEQDNLLRKRFRELSHNAWQRNIPRYTDFLNLYEQSILHSMPQDELDVKPIFFGGYDEAERQMAAFLPDALFYTKESIPITLICVEPRNKKFQETLSHRDFLGSVLALGIERKCIGDIIIDENKAYIFIIDRLGSFIYDELNKVKNTLVNTSITDIKNFSYRPKTKSIRDTVASVRLDSLISITFKMSRVKCTALLREGKVFVNGRCIVSNGYNVKNNDLISIRGLGKFCYIGEEARSKKGRIFVTVEKYI